MAIWQRGGTTTSAEGKTVLYWLPGTEFEIESRTRHIPHANKIGTWDYTTYVVTRRKNGQSEDLKVLHRLIDAKEWAEKEADKEAAGGTV